jgi:hypothetical protein
MNSPTPTAAGRSNNRAADNRVDAVLLIAFAAGLASRLNVTLIGVTSVTEFLFALLGPYFLLTRPQASFRLHATPICLLLLWTAGTIFTDVVTSTSLPLMARGLASPLFILLAIPTSYALFRSSTFSRILAYSLGAIPGYFLEERFFRSGVLLARELTYGSATVDWTTFWTGLANTVASIGVLLFFRRSRLLAYATSFGMFLIQLYGGSRGAAIPWAVGPFASLAFDLLNNKVLKTTTRSRVAAILVTATFMIIAAVAVSGTYSNLAIEGRLGQAAKEKYLRQANTSYGLASGGRMDFFIGIYFLKKSPFIGYGSWAYNDPSIVNEALAYFGDDRDASQFAGRRITSHSAFLTSWIESGILAVPFWLWFIVTRITPLTKRSLLDASMRLTLQVSSIQILLNTLINPLSSRLGIASSIAIITILFPATKAGITQSLGSYGRSRRTKATHPGQSHLNNVTPNRSTFF